MLKRTLSAAIMAFCSVACLSLPATAQVLNSIDNVVSVTFLEGWRQEDGAHYAGIQIDLAPGWNTYWRAPGDGGIPTTATWDRSKNLEHAQVLWPRPQVFRTYGLRSVGYKNRVVLPVHMTALRDGPIDVELDMRLGVCKEICLPVDISLSGRIDPTVVVGKVPIQLALTDRPTRVDADMECTLVDMGDEYRLDIAAFVAVLAGNAETSVVEFDDKTIWVSEPDFSRNGDRVMSSVRVIRQEATAQIDLSSVRMTMLTTTSAVELSGCD